MERTIIRIIGSVLLPLLLCAEVDRLHAQDYLRHGGYDKPNVMAGVTYDIYFNNSLFNQLSLQLSLAPSILSPLPVIGDSKHLEQGSLLDVAVRLERDTSMHSRVRWKGTLLDFIWTSREYPMDWKDWSPLSSPIDADPWYRSTHLLAGLTLLSYDGASLADLDARWLAVRAGVGGEQDLRSRLPLAVEWKLMAGAGASTFRPGEAHYSDLGLDVGITQTGTEANADFALAIKRNIGKYRPHRQSLGLRSDVAVRHLFADLPLSIATIGVALTFMTSTAHRTDWRQQGNSAGIEGIIRFERQILRLNDREQATERLQIGAQYSFW
jgi:hypothetical protein